MAFELSFGEFTEETPDVTQVQQIDDQVTPEELDQTIDETEDQDSGVIETPSNLEFSNDSLIELTNSLSSKGLLDELPEGIDTENFTADEFIKVLEHNFNKRNQATKAQTEEEVFSRVITSLSPQVQKLVEYEINGGEDVETILKTLVHTKELNELDLDDSSDQARIVREYYQSIGDTPEEVESRIQDLVEVGMLQKEASKVKPKLDKKAEEIATKKINDQKELVQYENQVRKQLESKVTNVLQKGNVNGIPLTKEASNFLLQGIVNDDIPITFKGKKMNVSLDQALVLHHKYSDKGNIENLMEALLLLQHPEIVKQHYDKKAVSKETDLFKREHSYSASVKTGKLIDKQSKKSQGFILNRNNGIK